MRIPIYNYKTWLEEIEFTLADDDFIGRPRDYWVNAYYTKEELKRIRAWASRTARRARAQGDYDSREYYWAIRVLEDLNGLK